MKTNRRKIYELLEVNYDNNFKSVFIDRLIIVLIALNIVALVLETVNEIYVSYEIYFKMFDRISIFAFTLEYALRVWSFPERFNGTCFKEDNKARLKYIFSLYALIDLIAFLPFYFGIESRYVRMFRLLRIAKLTRYSESFRLLFRIIYSERDKLIVSTVLLMIVNLFLSCLMFFIENPVQPENFSSIPATMWWSIVTLTTVGYGDISPITPLGKFIAGCTAFLGIGLFAIPTGIISGAFVKDLERER